MGKIPLIKPSLAGFNTSKRADRSSKEAFVASYIKVYPDREHSLLKALPSLDDWLTKMLSKPKHEQTKLEPEKRVYTRHWVPRDQWIPDNPNFRYGYKREATNIARAMRLKIEQEEQT